MKRRMTALLARSGAAAKRFYMACAWCQAAFLLLAWDLFAERGAEPALLAAALCAAFLAAALACGGEAGRDRPYDRRQLLSIPAAGAWYAYFSACGSSERTLSAACFCAACFAAGLYVLTKRSGEGAFAQVFLGAWKTLGAAVLLAASLMVCLLAADTLLFDVDGRWHTLAAEWAFVAVAGPLFLSWVPDGEAEPSAALSALFRRLLLPVYLVLLAILYGYLGKILWTGAMPSGQMNWFASLASGGYALCYFLFPGTGGRAMRAFLRWGGPALLPVVAVQLVCVWIRFDAYGLTSARYASLLCTVFGLAVMAFGFFRRSPRGLFLLAAAMALAASAGPAGLYALPLREQVYRAQTVLERYGMMKDGDIAAGRPLTDEDRARLVSAWAYIRRQTFLDDRADYTFADQIARSEEISRLAAAQTAAGRSVVPLSDMTPADISGYSRLYEYNGTTDGVFIVEGRTYDARAVLEDFFATRPEGEQTAPMTWEADETHTVLFRRCTRMQEEGPPRYMIYAWILER